MSILGSVGRGDAKSGVEKPKLDINELSFSFCFQIGILLVLSVPTRI